MENLLAPQHELDADRIAALGDAIGCARRRLEPLDLPEEDDPRVRAIAAAHQLVLKALDNLDGLVEMGLEPGAEDDRGDALARLGAELKRAGDCPCGECRRELAAGNPKATGELSEREMTRGGGDRGRAGEYGQASGYHRLRER